MSALPRRTKGSSGRIVMHRGIVSDKKFLRENLFCGIVPEQLGHFYI